MSCLSAYRLQFAGKNTLNGQLTLTYNYISTQSFLSRKIHEISTIIPLQTSRDTVICNSSDLVSIIGKKKLMSPINIS